MNGMTIVLMDTEGLGSFTKSKTYDVKIFTLAVLLSSLFIYNSMGSIDESALDRLALVSELSNHIRLQMDDDRGADPAALSGFFPKFLWLVRDFGLRLELDGRMITEDEYFENVLKPMEGDSQKVRTRNAIRQSIVQYFPDRHCFTLKRPVTDEKALQTLDSVAESDLRPQFLEQMDHLLRHVYSSIRVKTLYGHPLSGSMLVALAQSYTKALNEGGIPVIRSAWENVMHTECTKAVQAGTKQWDTRWGPFVAEQLPQDFETLEQHYFTHFQDTMEGFRLAVGEKHLDGAKPFEEQLIAHIRKAWKATVSANQLESQKKCARAIGPVAECLQSLASDEGTTLEQFEAELVSQITDEYFPKCCGPATHVCLADYLQKKVPGLVNLIHRNILREKDREVELQMSERSAKMEGEKKQVEKLLVDTRNSFLKSREEVTQLAAENQQLVRVVERFSTLMQDEDLRPAGVRK